MEAQLHLANSTPPPPNPLTQRNSEANTRSGKFSLANMYCITPSAESPDLKYSVEKIKVSETLIIASFGHQCRLV